MATRPGSVKVSAVTWLESNAVALLTIAIVAWLTFALVRALVIAARRRGERLTTSEEFSHGERVRQQIRRKIADRKSTGASDPGGDSPRVPATPARGIPPIDPFGGRSRRWWDRLARWLSGRR